MTILASKAKTLLTAGLTALALGIAVPAQAGDLPHDDNFDDRPQVERRVTIEERRIVQPAYETRVIERPVHVRPAYETRIVERPVHVRPAYAGGDCRVIVKKHIDPWGDRVVKRVRICD